MVGRTCLCRGRRDTRYRSAELRSPASRQAGRIAVRGPVGDFGPAVGRPRQGAERGVAAAKSRSRSGSHWACCSACGSGRYDRNRRLRARAKSFAGTQQAVSSPGGAPQSRQVISRRPRRVNVVLTGVAHRREGTRRHVAPGEARRGAGRRRPDAARRKRSVLGSGRRSRRRCRLVGHIHHRDGKSDLDAVAVGHLVDDGLDDQALAASATAPPAHRSTGSRCARRRRGGGGGR